MSVIYRINMSDLSVRAEQPSEQYESLGGRGLTSAIVADEVPADMPSVCRQRTSWCWPRAF